MLSVVKEEPPGCRDTSTPGFIVFPPAVTGTPILLWPSMLRPVMVSDMATRVFYFRSSFPWFVPHDFQPGDDGQFPHRLVAQNLVSTLPAAKLNGFTGVEWNLRYHEKRGLPWTISRRDVMCVFYFSPSQNKCLKRSGSDAILVNSPRWRRLLLLVYRGLIYVSGMNSRSFDWQLSHFICKGSSA